MSAPGRPGVLAIGDRVRLAGRVRTVVGVSGTRIRLADVHGAVEEVAWTTAQASDDFELVVASARCPAPVPGSLEGLPQPAVEQALWWEQHIVEVLHGLPAGAARGARPRPEYDPATQPLSRRERAKAEELSAAGHKVTASTVKHRRQRYEAQGVFGLVDHRAAKQMSPFGRVTPVVVEAMRQAIEEATDDSSRTASFVLWRTGQILGAGESSAPQEMPSRRTLYRLFAKLSAGLHTTGSATTRRSLAGRPDGPFSSLAAHAPGEVMQIDSTPMDVLVRLDDGVVGRVELTGMVDVATRTVTAVVLRPATKSVDASVLLARTVTPEPMRPGWRQALAMSRSVLPHRRLCDIDQRLEHAAARPVIAPETIVCDHGKVFISRNFRASCRFLGINFQPTHQATPTDKPHIERTLGSVATLFSQFVAGYVGSSADRRGRGLEQGPVWSLLELQELLDEWIVAAWQNRPHDGLRDPAHPGRAFTPNEKYAALVETAGYVPIALSPTDYIELLPACWRAINAYGVKIGHRTYDSEQLNPLRRQRSGVRERKNLWEIHYDPYDVSRVWVRDHWNGGWIMLFWKHLHRVPAPFGELAWDHVRGRLPAATEEEIADAVADLLQRAHRGPADPAPKKASRRDRQVVARTRATPASSPPESAGKPPRRPAPTPDDDAADGVEPQTLAKVIPLGIFDPFREADKRW